MGEVSLSTLAQRIKAARKAKKRTQDDVAKAIGVSKNTISDWERGLKQPGVLNLLNYCYFLGITLDELLEFKKRHYLLIIATDEERDNILVMLSTCQREAQHNPEMTLLHKGLDVLEQQINSLFSRAQRQ